MKLNDMIAKKLRKDFPLLSQKINGKPIIFIDNASTTQKPKEVIEAVSGFYKHTNANVHRGVYPLSEEATKQYEAAHAVVAKFINASPEEIIFTKNTTESINLLAYTLTQQLEKDDEIVLTEMEHHSNIVP